MRNPIKALAVTSALVVGLTIAPALHAHESGGSDNSTRGPGMMGMMGQMGEMMKGCSKMMQSMNQGGSGRPNEQWREEGPARKATPGTGG